MPTTGAPTLVWAWSVEEVGEVHQGRHDATSQVQKAQAKDDGDEEEEPRKQVPGVGAGQDATQDAEADAEHEASPGDPTAAAHAARFG